LFRRAFLTIGAAWLLHTALTDRLARADPVFLQINLLVLLVVAFLPFPTRLVTDALHEAADAERVAVTIYGLTLLAIRILGSAVALYFGITVYLIVPFREVARLLSRRP
jgi:uncharacterized membrane protein